MSATSSTAITATSKAELRRRQEWGTFSGWESTNVSGDTQQAKGISDLLSRTNSCFEKSMNGKPLPLDSKEMIALVTYYQWISKGLPIYADIPWLGVQQLKSAHKPDHAKGQQVFAQKCFMCHGDNGEGTRRRRLCGE